MKIPPLNSLVWGSLRLAPIMVRLFHGLVLRYGRYISFNFRPCRGLVWTFKIPTHEGKVTCGALLKWQV